VTVVAADAAEMDIVTAAASGLDPDADVGFWSMSPASAEQVTVQIRTVLDRAWEFIALAYKGRAFIALGYANWDAYVDARFGDLRIAVPREHRAQVVAELAGVRMSCRAIAKVLGVGVATVHRELTRSSLGDPPGTADGGGVGVVDRARRQGVPPCPPARTPGGAVLDVGGPGTSCLNPGALPPRSARVMRTASRVRLPQHTVRTLVSPPGAGRRDRAPVDCCEWCSSGRR